MNNTRSIELLLSLYEEHSNRLKSSDNLELEIRYKSVTRGNWISIYKYLQTNVSNGKLSTTVDVFGPTESREKIIKQSTYTKGIKIGEQFMKKLQLGTPVIIFNPVKYSIVLSLESIVKNPPSYSFEDIIRYKTRISYEIASLWRVDITIVKQSTIGTLRENILHFLKLMFPTDLSINNITEIIPEHIISSYEVELEYIGKSKPILTDISSIIAKTIMGGSDNKKSDEYMSILEKLCNYIKGPNVFHRRMTLRNIIPQVITLTKNEYYSDLFPPKNMYIVDKADGIRCVAYINDKECILITSQNITSSTIQSKNIEVIFDCEQVGNSLLVFDMPFASVSTIETYGLLDMGTLDNRIINIKKILSLLSTLSNGTTFELKGYVKLTDEFCGEIHSVINNQHKYETDGIIFTTNDKPYLMTRSYKWKPIDKLSIDLFAVKCPMNCIGIGNNTNKHGHTLYWLFCAIPHTMRISLGIGMFANYKSLFPNLNNPNYYPVQFSPAINSLAYLYYHPENLEDINRKIVELVWDISIDHWKFVRVRNDRSMEQDYYGNMYKNAEIVYNLYLDQFSVDDLCSKDNSGYFEHTATDIYKASIIYKRYVFDLFLQQHVKECEWLIDMGAGRGGDIHRYIKLGVNNLVCIDADPSALVELTKRRYKIQLSDLNIRKTDMNTRKLTPCGIYKTNVTMSIHAIVFELGSPVDALMNIMNKYGINEASVPYITCNFAFHYMCDNIGHLTNMLGSVARLLSQGGKFICTVMDGKKVFDLLAEHKLSESYDFIENDVIKYQIIKKYMMNKFLPVGQMIAIKLPFADHPKIEPLVNLDEVYKIANQVGLKVNTIMSFDKLYNQFMESNANMWQRLSDIDKQYINLHTCFILVKI